MGSNPAHVLCFICRISCCVPSWATYGFLASIAVVHRTKIVSIFLTSSVNNIIARPLSFHDVANKATMPVTKFQHYKYVAYGFIAWRGPRSRNYYVKHAGSGPKHLSKKRAFSRLILNACRCFHSAILHHRYICLKIIERSANVLGKVTKSSWNIFMN